jgi:hypothetical protein
MNISEELAEAIIHILSARLPAIIHRPPVATWHLRPRPHHWILAPPCLAFSAGHRCHRMVCFVVLFMYD